MLITFDDIKKIDFYEISSLLLLYWDIEKSSSQGPGFFLLAENDKDYVYIIQFDIVFYNESFPIRRFCLTTIPINSELFSLKYPETSIIFIELQTQEELLLKFAELFAKLLNIDEQFTGLLTKTKTDLQFNIHQVTVRVVDHNIEKEDQKYGYAGINMNNRSIKISSTENMQCEFMRAPGTVFLDFLVWAKKTFQTEITNILDAVLKYCGLSGKIDLPYIPIKNSVDMRCMFVYVNVIKFKNNKQILNKLSEQLSKMINISVPICLSAFHVSESVLEDYAIEIGCLVWNLICRYASRENILVSSRHKGTVQQGKYEGALVIPPVKNNKRPTADVDFTSYYPNSIIQNNISLKTHVSKESTDSSLNVVIDNDTIYGKFLPHNGDVNKIEIMPHMYLTKHRYYTSLSDALKVFANSVYGETGYRYSSLYHEEVASSVTAFCRAILQVIINFVREQGFIVIYRDTDSIFYSLPESYFIELDLKYSNRLLTKKEYWEEQIKLTIQHFQKLEKNINDFLQQIMKSSYLKMAYEKTLFPFLIFEKKHYIGIKHFYKPDLDNLKLLLKGLKIVKRNVSEFYKIIAKELIYSLLGFNKDFSIHLEEIDRKELVLQIITEYVNKKETMLDLFVLIAKYDLTYAAVSAKDFAKTLDHHLYSNEERASILAQVFLSATKKGNKIVFNFIFKLEEPIESGHFFYYIVTKPGKSSISDKMILIKKFDPKRNTIDIIHYFYSLRDIVAYLLGCKEKQALQKIKEIFDADELRKQQKITEFFVNDTQQKITEFAKVTPI
ncbi:6893_t:CDS:2 [Cetraspora pellucida]|uniref:DNA-directed DNA polymerase n=1 Tax=Cetraspora pellucida TaxID=1433469 RepID=A0A9N8VPJ0_9GLOM|nr:6893_t:CDS:2 [Cetraspora pellucida]